MATRGNPTLFSSWQMIGVCALFPTSNLMQVFIPPFVGWTDVGYRNPDVHTPNIDYLSSEGVRLEQNYVQAMCTPSRSALLTGMYPYHIGKQVTRGLSPMVRSLTTYSFSSLRSLRCSQIQLAAWI